MTLTLDEEEILSAAIAGVPEFSTIRRKLARWAADNVRIIKDRSRQVLTIG